MERWKALWCQLKRIVLGRNTLLSYVLLPCIVILVLMAVLCGVEYRYAYGISRKSTIDSQQVALAGAASQLDNAIHSLNSLADSVNSSRLITLNVRENIETGSVTAAKGISDSLPALQADGQLIGDYFLYIQRSGRIFGCSQGMLTPELYYGRFFGSADISYEEWYNELLGGGNYHRLLSSREVLIDSQRTNALIYKIPYSATSDFGSFVYYIYTDGLRELFAPSLDAGSYLVYLTGKDGEPLACFSNDAEVETDYADYLLPENLADSTDVTRRVRGRWMMYTQTTLKNCPATITMVTPTAAVERQAAHSLRVMLLLILLTMLAVGAVMIRYIASVRKPLKHLSTTIGRANVEQAPFIHLDQAFLKVTDDNEQLNIQLRKHRDALLEAVISDRRINRQVYNLLSEDIDNPFGTDVFFRGVYMQTTAPLAISGEKQFEAIAEEASLSAACLKLLSKRNDHTFALLHLSDSEQPEELRRHLEQLDAELQSRHGIFCRFFVGPACTALQRVCYSFTEAWRLVEGIDVCCGDLVNFSREMSQEQRYVYRETDEKRLRSLCEDGDVKGVKELLRVLYEENFVQMQLNRFMQQLLYVRLVDTLTYCSDASSVLEELGEERPPEEIFALLTERFCEAACQNNRKKDTDAQELNRQIVEYIQLNFRDPDLCLASIASVFGMTESYLSVLIKNTLNQNYSAYLNSLRIQYANELLKSDRYSIERIAEMAGYNNASTFRRAYKRVMGYSPSAYRDQTDEANEGDNQDEDFGD